MPHDQPHGALAWMPLLGGDPRRWLLASDRTIKWPVTWNGAYAVLDALAEAAAAVDVCTLGSSKGGSGVAVPHPTALRPGGADGQLLKEADP